MSSSAREQRLVFGEVAETYDRVRPGYPDQIFDLVMAQAGVERPHAVEIGAGTGRATLALAPRCSSVTALEPSSEMAAVARRRLQPHAWVEVVESTFEAWAPSPPVTAHLVVAAQSWHWVDTAVGPAKAASILDGGVLALIWNRPERSRIEIDDQIRQVYSVRAPSLSEGLPWEHTIGGDLQALTESGAFAAPSRFEVGHEVRYSTADYLDLMRTQSNHRLLPPEELENLLQGLGEVIESAGGHITVPYTTLLITLAPRSRGSRALPHDPALGEDGQAARDVGQLSSGHDEVTDTSWEESADHGQDH